MKGVSMAYALGIILAIIAGSLLPIQAGINSSLGKHLNSWNQAAFINFLGGIIIFTSICFVAKVGLPSVKTLSQAPAYMLIGGLLGGCMVITAIIFAPKIGAVTLMACLLTGQMISSVILDHHGWVGFEVHPVNIYRILGIFLLLGGVYLIQKF